MTAEQTCAVSSEAKKLLLTAVAGAGKTLVLIERIKRLIRDGVDQSRIAAISFTTSAAGQLAKRLAPIQLGCCATLHGLMVRLLKQYGPAYGWPAKFGILSELQTEELIAQTAQEMRYAGTRKELDLAIKSHGPRAAQLSKAQLVAAAFYQTLQRNNLMTFDLILQRGADLIERMAASGAEWPYTHLLWDEGQDSNRMDLLILEAMPCESKTVCADFRQSIYGFRGTDYQCVVNYFNYSGWTHLNLTHNFRCDSAIVAAANALLNGSVTSPPMVSATGEVGKVYVCRAETGEREIVIVADDIRQLLKLAPETSVAVLLRTNALVAQWTKGLADMGLPVSSRVVSLPDDWQNVLTFLGLLCDPDNDWLAYRCVAAFRGQEIADELRRKALTELRTINQVGLNIPTVVEVETALQRLSVVVGGAAMDVLRRIVENAPPDFTVPDLLEAAQRHSFGETEKAGVTVTTIHSYKGLEADVIVIGACNDGILPTNQAIKTGDWSEETRLFYVGVTRARHMLILSYAEKRRNQFTNQFEDQVPSRFLKQMGLTT